MNNQRTKFRHLFLVVGILLFFASANTVHAVDRFAPIGIQVELDKFNQRFTNNNPNIDFIVAEVLNNARQIERAGEGFRQTASIITNRTNNSTNNNDNRAFSNSVVVEAGVKVDTLIIINESKGDSYAIQR